MAAFTMYTTAWCGYCHRLKRQLEHAKITYTEVDIEQQPDAARIVERVNDGNQTVPTVVFRDGTAMTNPSLSEITEKLTALRAVRIAAPVAEVAESGDRTPRGRVG